MKKLFYVLTAIFVALALVSCKGGKVDDNVIISEEGINSKLVSNELFGFNLPVSYEKLCTTETTDHSITIYDKESVDKGNPGMLFGIYLYETPSEWSTGPFEKVGEITIGDKLYDVVLLYATESQFGFDTMEMPENYKKLYDARFEIVRNIVGKNGEKFEYQKGTKGKDLYNDILNKYIKAIKEEWDSTKLENENMSPMVNVMKSTGLDVFSTLGYAYKDINIDGVEELLIGDVESNVIYDVYTMVDRKVSHVVSGWDRNRFYLVDSLIVNEYSNGANESGTIVYNLLSNSTELFFQLGFKYDGYENEEKPYFISYNENNGEILWENVDKDNYDEMSNRFNDYLKIDYMAFQFYQANQSE